MFYKKLEEVNNKSNELSKSSDSLNNENKNLRSENNTLTVKVKMLNEMNDTLKLENDRLKDASKDRLQVLEGSKYLNEQIERLNTEINAQRSQYEDL